MAFFYSRQETTSASSATDGFSGRVDLFHFGLLPPQLLVDRLDVVVSLFPQLDLLDHTRDLVDERLLLRFETGRTRVRRFTTERAVDQDVTLHEEHAEVLRKAISQPAELTDVDWADNALEVIETKEQALVNKISRVVEEIQLRKKGDDHVETIHEKLRRHQAEVEQVDATGKPIRRA